MSTPFGLLGCEVPTDGSIAVVVSHTAYARDCPRRAVSVEAIGGWYHRDDYPKMAMSDASARMWSRTQLTPADLDVAELYDGFTLLTLACLEALAICGDGEGGPFVAGGARIARDGALPLNTYGGQLSAGACTATGHCTRAACNCAAKRGSGRCRSAPRSPWFPSVAVPSRDACCSRVDTRWRKTLLRLG